MNSQEQLASIAPNPMNSLGKLQSIAQPYEFTGKIAIHGQKPDEVTGEITIHGPKPTKDKFQQIPDQSHNTNIRYDPLDSKLLDSRDWTLVSWL